MDRPVKLHGYLFVFLSVCIFLPSCKIMLAYVYTTYPNLGIARCLRILSLYFYLCVFFTLARRSPCIFISLCIFHLRDASSTSSYVVFSPPQSASHNVARPTRKYCALVNTFLYFSNISGKNFLSDWEICHSLSLSLPSPKGLHHKIWKYIDI